MHEFVNHMERYVRGQVHTNGLENFWSLFKRHPSGTYVAVEPFHMQAYLDEQVFRYTNRATKENPKNDADRFDMVLRNPAGKRFIYGGVLICIAVSVADGSAFLRPLSAPFGLKFRLDLRVRNCQKSVQ